MECDYGPGHPWYYKLGGSILRPKQIFNNVKAAGYPGYKTEIDQASKKPEPQRSEALRQIKKEVIAEYRRDMSRYREVVVQLRRHWKEKGLVSESNSSESIHSNVSLKYNHLYNDFAHLIRLEELLSYQPDLFKL